MSSVKCSKCEEMVVVPRKEILSTAEHTDENVDTGESMDIDEGWTWGVVPTCGYL